MSSPSGQLKAVVFSRNRDATTGVKTRVSILRSEEALPDEAANTFFAMVPCLLPFTGNTAKLFKSPYLEHLPQLNKIALFQG